MPTFNLADMLSLLGLAQSLYLLVYILFRAGHIRHVIVPALCFLVLSLAFAVDMAAPRFEDVDHVDLIQNIIWIFIPAFSVLLIGQVADLGALPRKIYWTALLFPLAATLVSFFTKWDQNILHIAGEISGAACFLMLWIGRKSFADLRDDKATKGERYWLILSCVIMNMLMMMLTLLYLSEEVQSAAFVMIRDVLGIGMVYLASTSLLRIYPQAVKLILKAEKNEKLSNEDKELINNIQKLIDLDKVYQEPNFSRAGLARELDTSEAKVSRLVSIHFGKSLPQVVNELRVRDSLQLLEQTDVAVSIVAEEVGFNSLPTFNRVFKDVTGQSPSEYRAKNKKIG